MPQYDLWLDLECTIDGTRTAVCTLFAKRDFPVRPNIGESVTFWSAKGSAVSFNLVDVRGTNSLHYVPTEIDDLAHHFHPNDGAVSAAICIRCVPVHVATVTDARRVAAFLSEQHGFEVDPYGINRLSEVDNAG